MPGATFKDARPKRYSTSGTNIGTTNVAIVMTGVPRKGWLHQVIAEITAGPGTKVRVVIRESAAGRIVAEYPLLSSPLNMADGALYYQIDTGEDLSVEVGTDDVGATTSVSVELTLERA